MIFRAAAKASAGPPDEMMLDCSIEFALKGVTLVNTPTHSWKNISATPAPFKLAAGMYKLTVHAETWGGGSVTLQRLAADGATYATAFKVFSADGSDTSYVPSGAYQLTIAAATNTSADLLLTETF